jgi:hypothetical protein
MLKYVFQKFSHIFRIKFKLNELGKYHKAEESHWGEMSSDFKIHY